MSCLDVGFEEETKVVSMIFAKLPPVRVNGGAGLISAKRTRLTRPRAEEPQRNGAQRSESDQRGPKLRDNSLITVIISN